MDDNKVNSMNEDCSHTFESRLDEFNKILNPSSVLRSQMIEKRMSFIKTTTTQVLYIIYFGHFQSVWCVVELYVCCLLAYKEVVIIFSLVV